jgi:opacity protein-like surface antigen
MFRKALLAMMSAVVAMAGASAAGAEEPRAAAAKAVTNERGYGYVFHDDPLAAGQFGSTTAVIRVRPRGGHAALIRPRVQFVTEMLKSADSL